MKKLYTYASAGLLVASMFAFVAAPLVTFAQNEEAEPMTTEEVSTTTTTVETTTTSEETTSEEMVLTEEETELNGEEEMVLEEEVMMDEGSDEVVVEDELTAEEEAAIIEESVEATVEEIETEVLTGEVVLVTEESVFIENEDGDVVEVSLANFTQAQNHSNGSVVTSSSIKRGDTISVVPTTGSTLAGRGAQYVEGIILLRALDAEQQFTVLPTTKVIKNGQVVAQSELDTITEDTLVTVVIDENGDLLAVTLTDESVEMEKEKSGAAIWIILGVVIVLLAAFGRKNKGTEEA